MTYTPVRPDALLPPVRVNLYSDTQTRPSPEMKAAMMAAELGDEQHGDDPTVHALCDRMAALLGKPAAVFLPSGTMCNQIAILTHCRPGDEIIAHETHMDGARLMNAVVAAGIPAAEMVAGCDSVWVDFTKGLGAPLGAVLCGGTDFIDTAWRWKQRLGGSMRQAGICAAACLYALDHNIDRLADDHANAKALARGLAQIPGLTVEEPETNLVFFDTTGTGLAADELAMRLRKQGIMLSTMGHYRARACTHLDVDLAGVETAVQVIRSAIA